jgi:tetratricopeptide (TPR) repeat protein
LGSNISVPELLAPARCSVCDLDPCFCHELKAHAEQHARTLTESALRIARDGHYSSALGRLQESDDPVASAAAGLCALAVGRPDEAGRRWRAAIAADPASPARRWLQALETGDIRTAIEAYNVALSAASSGDHRLAERALQRSRELLPEFEPTERLTATLRRARTLSNTPGPSKLRIGRRVAGAIGACLVLVAAAFHLGTRVGSRSAGAPAATMRSRPVGAPASATVDTREQMSHTIGQVLAGDVDSIVALASQSHVDTLGWPMVARERMRRLQESGARRHFAAGLKALRAASPEQAVPHLAAAARLGDGAYIEDDALYELARAQWRSGAHTEAARTAHRLLTDFPNSIYANSTMRALADTVPNTISP